jgi:hypothetical protein
MEVCTKVMPFGVGLAVLHIFCLEQSLANFIAEGLG